MKKFLPGVLAALAALAVLYIVPAASQEGGKAKPSPGRLC